MAGTGRGLWASLVFSAMLGCGQKGEAQAGDSAAPPGQITAAKPGRLVVNQPSGAGSTRARPGWWPCNPALQGVDLSARLEEMARPKDGPGAGSPPSLPEALLPSPFVLEDARWFAALQSVMPGQPVLYPSSSDKDASFWHNQGFDFGPDQRPYRAAELLASAQFLVPTETSKLQHIDCFAIIAVNRRSDAEPYLYGTLRSLFAALSSPVEVNVLLSNDDDDFVSPSRLAQVLGPELATHVHVWPASAEAAAFVEAHLPPSRRGGWNYTRALQAYGGDKGLLLMEDDVAVSLGGIEAFDRQLSSQPFDVVSLFNFHCERLNPEVDFDVSPLFLQGVEPEWHFYSGQAIYYRPHLTAAIARYVQLRMHQQNHDNIVGEFFTDYRLGVGYAVPSIVQHTGVTSAYGTTSFHQSGCFRDDSHPILPRGPLADR